MITIEIEFTTKTVLGLSEAKVYKSEYGNYGAYIKDMVKWVQKAINSENVIRPSITFGYDNDSLYGVSTSRIIVDYWDIKIVKWDDLGNVTENVKVDKVDAKTIKLLYWENVLRLHDWEERQKKQAV